MNDTTAWNVPTSGPGQWHGTDDTHKVAAFKADMRAREAMAEARAAMQEKEAAEAKAKAQAAEIAYAVDISMQRHRERESVNNFRVEVRDGVATQTKLNAVLPGDIGAPPKALVDSLPYVTLPGGMQISTQQAKEMLETGQISKADYQAAFNAALKPLGYSFR